MQELTEFNPPHDIDFNDFLKEVAVRSVSDFTRVLVNGALIRFIANMHEKGLDEDLTVDFSHDAINVDGVDQPTLVLTLKANGIHKAKFILVLTKDKKQIKNFIQES